MPIRPPGALVIPVFLALLLSNALGPGVARAAQAPAGDAVPASSPASFERDLTSGCGGQFPDLTQFRCVETELGWIVSNDRPRAAEMLAAWRTAAAKFRKVFGRPVSRGVILAYVGEDVRLSAEALGQMGARWVMPIVMREGVEFPGQTDSAALAASRPAWEQATRDALRQRWPTLTAARLRDTVAQLWTERVHHMLHDDSWYLVHEIAHHWFAQAFTWNPAWPPARTQPQPSDWSGLDQWLNEASGILMEGPYWQRIRQARLAELYREDASFVVPLDTLFASPHPLNGPHGVMSGQFDQRYKDAFYSQISGLLAFLIEQSRDSTVLGAIAAAEERGATVAEWLRAEGGRYELPETVEALDREWRRWLERHVLAKY